MANHLLDDLKEDWVANQIISPNGEPFGQEKFGWNYIMKKINSMIRMLNSHADSIENQVRFEFVSAVPDPADAEFNVIYLVPNGSPTISGSSYDEYCLVQSGSTRRMEKFGPATITKSEVGLGNVVNTGDSDTPESGGTDKFTTGGAYTELNKKVDKTTKVNGFPLTGDVVINSQEIFTNRAIALGSTEDLDTIKTPGIYYQTQNVNTSSAHHYPENNAGTLIVYRAAGVLQEYHIYNSSKVYRRAQYSTSPWTAWHLVYTTGNKPSLADIGAAAASHTHSAGDITSGTLPAARGGTGQTTLNSAANSLINSLPTASTNPVDGNYYLAQNNDGSDTYYRRSVSALYNYIKSKTDAVYLKLTGGTMTGRIVSTSNHALGRNDTTAYLQVEGGTGEATGAFIVLRGKDSVSGIQGEFYIAASKGTPVKLAGTPAGALTWAEKNIVRSIDGINADGTGNVQTITSARLYPFKWTVDLTGLNENTYYPVVSTPDPYGQWSPDQIKRSPPIRLVLNVALKQGGIPSWATHSSEGFACRIQCDFQGAGWGMATRPYLIVHQQSYSFSNKSPAFIRQLTNSGRVCFYLRGGGKYPIYSNWNFESWQICTTSTTFSEQTVAPITDENILGTRMVGEKPLYNLYSSPGAIIWHAKTTPAGYLLCNGAAVSRVNYAELFAVIGTTYGSGDGSTTFNLPNLIDKFIQGSGTAGTVKAASMSHYHGFGYNDNNGGRFLSTANKVSITTYDIVSGTGCTQWNGSGSGGEYYSGKPSRMDLITSLPISASVQPPAVTMLPCIKY